MKSIITIPNIGPLGATYQVECELTEEEARIIKQQIMEQFKAQSAIPARQSTNKSHGSSPAPAEKGFVPITDGQQKALSTIAGKAGKSVDQFCHDHGLMLDALSKEECRQFLREFNHKSGYDKVQQARHRNYSQESLHPRSDRYPDDSDVFGNQ